MEQKDLRKLRRSDLFSLLVSQAEEIERLEQKVTDLQAQVDEKEILIREAGSIAEAALQVQHIFEAAQRAADLYVENVKRLTDAEKETEEKE
ncbi:hypothetical protein [Streptococcus ovis]|uniref:hypothetical protein n=1 Tax=Streptococcus ovis TaxID=82806 RepID=UPI000360E28B|nr:hypothetical protein [Streptococcus ovis]